MKARELVEKTGIGARYAYYILRGQKVPSPDVAAALEKGTGIHRLRWLYPGEFDEDGNPVSPSPPEPQA